MSNLLLALAWLMMVGGYVVAHWNRSGTMSHRQAMWAWGMLLAAVFLITLSLCAA